jgi:hypothetical protein
MIELSNLSGRQDSNLRPPGPKPGTLPDCATPRTIFLLQHFNIRDPTGTRTPNRQLRRLMLYPVELSDPVHHYLFTSTYQISAERGGFEPPVQNDPYDSLANYWFKPLTHLSSVFSLKSLFLPGKGMQI